jgi:hypothetical protein
MRLECLDFISIFQNLRVYQSDYTFAALYYMSTMRPYGVGGGCTTRTTTIHRGYFQIDLRGTQFKVKEGVSAHFLWCIANHQWCKTK